MVSKFFRQLAIFLFALIWVWPAQAREFKSFEEVMRLGDRAYLNDKYGRAEMYYARAILFKPDQAIPVLRLGVSYYAQGRYAECLAQFQKASKLKKDPSSKEFLKAAIEKITNAQDLLARLEKATVEKDLVLQIQLNQDAFKKMIEAPVFMQFVEPHLRFLLNMDPSNSDILNFLAEGHYSSSDPSKAFLYTKQLVKGSRADLNLYKRYGDTAVNVGAYDEARLAYKKALRQAVRQNDEKEMNELKKLIRALPVFSSQIEELIQSENYAAAFRQLRKRLVRNSSDSWAIVQMGRIYEEVNRSWLAGNLYRQAVQAHYEDPNVHYALGRFYLLKKKEFEKAMEEFRLFRELLLENKELVSGETSLKEIQKNADEVTRYIVYIYLEILKKPKLAEMEMEALVKNTNAEARDYYSLGVIYLRNEKQLSAYQAMKKVIALDPDSEWGREAKQIVDSRS